MSDKNGRRWLNRRTVLKSLGVATALSTTGVSVGSASSEPSFQKILEQSHRVLEAAGVERQHEFLQNRGIAIARDSAIQKIPRKSDGLSTQKLVGSEISLTFSIYYNCYDHNYFAELTWEYDGSFDDTGDKPLDYVGIAWDDNTWYYSNNNLSDMYSNSPWVNYASGTSGEGPVWEINDNFTMDGGARGDNQDHYYVGVYLDWNGTGSLKDNRTIAASYTHTWNEVDITSVGVSFPAGISVTAENESKKWNKGTNDSGDFLRLRYDDVDAGNLDGCY